MLSGHMPKPLLRFTNTPWQVGRPAVRFQSSPTPGQRVLGRVCPAHLPPTPPAGCGSSTVGVVGPRMSRVFCLPKEPSDGCARRSEHPRVFSLTFPSKVRSLTQSERSSWGPWVAPSVERLWFQLGSCSQGRGIEPPVHLLCGGCSRFPLSSPPALSLSLKKSNKKNSLYRQMKGS